MESEKIQKLRQYYVVYGKRYEIINGRIKTTYSIVV